MITPILNDDGITGRILIEPNRPINWQDNVRFIKIVSVVAFLIACVAVYHGFFLVLPYSGIEVLLLSLCLYLVYKHYNIRQIIYFTNDSVIIESGRQHADQHIKYQRYWSKFHIDSKGNYDIPRLCIRSRGKSTEIGSFLGYTDKLILIDLVKKITADFLKHAH